MKTLTIELNETDHDRFSKLAEMFHTTPEKMTRWLLLSDLGAMEAPDLAGLYLQDVRNGVADYPSNPDASKVIRTLYSMFAGMTLGQMQRQLKRYEAVMEREAEKYRLKFAKAS